MGRIVSLNQHCSVYAIPAEYYKDISSTDFQQWHSFWQKFCTFLEQVSRTFLSLLRLFNIFVCWLHSLLLLVINRVAFSWNGILVFSGIVRPLFPVLLYISFCYIKFWTGLIDFCKVNGCLFVQIGWGYFIWYNKAHTPHHSTPHITAGRDLP